MRRGLVAGGLALGVCFATVRAGAQEGMVPPGAPSPAMPATTTPALREAEPEGAVAARAALLAALPSLHVLADEDRAARRRSAFFFLAASGLGAAASSWAFGHDRQVPGWGALGAAGTFACGFAFEAFFHRSPGERLARAVDKALATGDPPEQLLADVRARLDRIAANGGNGRRAGRWGWGLGLGAASAVLLVDGLRHHGEDRRDLLTAGGLAAMGAAAVPTLLLAGQGSVGRTIDVLRADPRFRLGVVPTGGGGALVLGQAF